MRKKTMNRKFIVLFRYDDSDGCGEEHDGGLLLAG